MLLSRDVWELVIGPYQSVAHQARAGALRADLESFVRGENIVVCLTPYKARHSDFGLLDPVSDGAWDYRSRKARPSIRLLGHFADIDTFVALTWWPRTGTLDWSNKLPLADADARTHSMRWRVAIHECCERWFEILPNSTPVTGQKVENYVSGKFLLG